MAEAARLLSDDEIRSVFEQDIRPTLTAPSRDTPRLLLFGGPQGSRKSTLTPLIGEQLGYQDAVRIDGDDLFDFHPAYAGLAWEHGANAAMKRCGPDILEFRARILDHVRQHRQNLMVIGPYTNTEYTMRMLRDFRVAGYASELAYTALHPALSELGVAHRYHQAVQPGGVGYQVLPDLEVMTSVVNGVPKVMEAVKESGIPVALHLVDASGVSFTWTQEAEGRWRPHADITQTLESTRNRPWDPQVRQDFRGRREAVGGGAGDRWSERLERIDTLARPMLRPDDGWPQSSASTPQQQIADAARARSTTAQRPPSSPGPQAPGARPGRPPDQPEHGHSRGR